MHLSSQTTTTDTPLGNTSVVDPNILAIVVASAASSSVFLLVILVLLLLLYHRDPECCQFLCSWRSIPNHPYTNRPPTYFNSNQRLVGSLSREQRGATSSVGLQDEVFCVGSPSSYQLSHWEQHHLPSYESVRKKDRQREIHQMIARRFGLWESPSQDSPPTYEEILRNPSALLPPSSGNAAGSLIPTENRTAGPNPLPTTGQTPRNTTV
ncbi:uncharacterized protein LOC115473407 isoform X3 [Microcaecilia unicolor]|uniref:Uncharacterized protein LOC115473407 isoform X3 n=1 Tax=Microcaecilia unicolor TaxID=1415580 RepID=A0A6P7YGR7_9AMPH|nr:uncharacterized protein LOC115473407 isoform X3 [Microcaecilia unicolor]